MHCLQGAQAAVQLSATYDALLTLTQLLCYCCEAWMRMWGRARILWRHSLVAGLLCMLVLVSANERMSYAWCVHTQLPRSAGGCV
jgi:hypothetical protein